MRSIKYDFCFIHDGEFVGNIIYVTVIDRIKSVFNTNGWYRTYLHVLSEIIDLDILVENLAYLPI